MADLSKIKVGDRLRIDGVVHKLETNRVYVGGLSSWGLWLDAFEVGVAEHIPAPKTFKRGDWVQSSRYKHNGRPRRGVVIADGLGILSVSWDDDPMQLQSLAADALEPDEAPE